MFFTGKKLCLKNPSVNTASTIVDYSRKSREEREKQRRQLFLVKLVQHLWRISLSTINYRKVVQSTWAFRNPDSTECVFQNEPGFSVESPSSFGTNDWYMRILREFLFFTKKIGDDSYALLDELISVLSSPRYLRLALDDNCREQWILQVSNFSGFMLSSLKSIHNGPLLHKLFEIVLTLTELDRFRNAIGVDLSEEITETTRKIGIQLIYKYDCLKLLSTIKDQDLSYFDATTYELMFMFCFCIYINFQHSTGVHKRPNIVANQNQSMFELLTVPAIRQYLKSLSFPKFADYSFECVLLLLKTVKHNPARDTLSVNSGNYNQVFNFLTNAMEIYGGCNSAGLQMDRGFTNEMAFYIGSFYKFADEHEKGMRICIESGADDDAHIDLCAQEIEIQHITSLALSLGSCAKSLVQLRAGRISHLFYSEVCEAELYSEVLNIADLLLIIKTYSDYSTRDIGALAEPVICLWPYIQRNFASAFVSEADLQASLLAIFCLSCEYVLSHVSFEEMDASSLLYQRQKQLMMKRLIDLTECQSIILFLKYVLTSRLQRQSSSSTPISDSFIEFMKSFNGLIKTVKKKNHIKKVISDSVFTIEKLNPDHLMNKLNPQGAIGRYVPFAIPLHVRVAMLHELISQDKQEFYGSFYDEQATQLICIRRGDGLLSDAFNKLNPLKGRLKGPIKIEFVSEHGVLEPGIDGGGLLREFLSEVMRLAFSPDYGLFLVTSQNQLYPNPDSAIYVEDHTKKFTFLGRLIGKCIYEMILLELPLAPFFLSYILGYSTSVEDLWYLDHELYRGIRETLSSPDVNELGLYFVTSTGTGGVHELIPDGNNVPVTLETRDHFAELLARYRLSVSIRDQSDAFFNGLTDIVQLDWLRMFDEEELIIVLCGGGRLDVQDLKAHTSYGNGFHAGHFTIRMLWDVLEELSDEQQVLFLKFTTSVSRPPILGFATLNPPFCIRKSENTTDFLPTANTCFNMLKLPPYGTKAQLREKLLYAINSGARFELS